MSELKSLIQSRGTIKARLTTFSKYVNNLVVIEPKAITKLQVADLQLKVSRCQELFTQFDGIQDKIDQLDPDSEEQLQEREIIENKFCSLISQSQLLIEAALETQAKLNNNDNNDNASHACSSSCHNSNIKLPTIKLPSFDGNFLKWLEFRDTFDSLVNKNESIPNINKFHYLRSSLEGSAAVIIKSIEFTSRGYTTAWELLCSRYDNKRLLVNHHFKSLFCFDPILKESHKSLRYMVDYYTKNLQALNVLDEPTDHWDSLIIYMMLSKLDGATGQRWEEHRSTINVSPSLNDFYQFLRNRADVLETLLYNRNDNRSKTDKPSDKQTSRAFVSSAKKACVICGELHLVYQCDKFKKMSVDQRLSEVAKLKLCANCLRVGHRPSRCFRGPCDICKEKHSSLLHGQADDKKNDLPNCSKSSGNSIAAPVSLSAVVTGQVLLCTAQVEVIDLKNNKTYLAKALLDSGSQSSFVTEGLQRKMYLPCSGGTPVSVSGINNAAVSITQRCNLQIKSRLNGFQMKVSCLVIPQITGMLPCVEIDSSQFNLPHNIELADPTFFRPSEIHILLGADVFWEFVNSKQIKLGHNNPTLQSSKLGWLISGPTGKGQSHKIVSNFSREVQDSLSKFWEIEELPSLHRPMLSKVEEFCEEHFLENTKRLENGRFSVMLPLSESPELALGESYNVARKRFFNLEKRLDKSPLLKKEYKEFIHEYEHLGHLSQVERPTFGYFIPHHAVIRSQSETTRLRVVFDASCKTSSGKSFNDIQLVGPVVQDDLMSILLRFRQNAYVVTGDIEKMYRQIKIDDSQRHLHLIIWRDDRSQPLKVLQLNTVTYGTAAAAFLSTRCLLQLSKECIDQPDIANVIQHDFYVDDLNTGSNSKQELQGTVKAVFSKLSEACFPLRKFRTNAPDIFEDFPITNDVQSFSKESTVLGLKWSPRTDTLKFSTVLEADLKVTKRNILSTSSKIFDPLGLLSATTILPKILLQKLWLLKAGWDDLIPDHINAEWKDFLSNIESLSFIQIPRHAVCSAPVDLEIHCFSDASQAAYGACLYLKSTDEAGKITCHLLCAKGKVAPLKPELTIPRLELMGALLAARLLTKVLQSSRYKDLKVSRCFLWTDSSIVLCWIQSQPRTLKTFVCNRIQEIRELTGDHKWRYVPTNDNPADLISRGVMPQHLQENKLWWHGASFLTQPEPKWPQHNPVVSALPETKVSLNVQCVSDIVPFDRYSNLYKLQRVFGYVLRFINNSRNKNNRVKGKLTVIELHQSLFQLAKISQQISFPNEIHSLKTSGSLNRKSSILSLNPTIDDEGMLRVGGRIQRASVSYDKRHPILIDSKHYFTKLLFSREHLRLLHCGPQQLLCSIRETFWPTGGRVLAAQTVNKCVRCTRLKGKTEQPLMGYLPKPRVTPSSPFETCGTDFAGPFHISSRKGRGSRTSKCYLCLFVCFSTKALHLEVVSDLSTNAFILCLRRFIARRGKPCTIYSDNGKNYVGANSELNRMLRAANESVADFGASEGIKFVFSPAYAPNFGGIWEAGVKAAKFHLKRIAGNSSLTFEELATLFAQIEAILNSRPLTPMSADPSDLTPLTPGHFLIGRPLSSLPSPVTEKLSINRYQQLERLRQHFWSRWTKEFLAELQQRVKWRRSEGPGVKVGDLVLIKDEQLPPLKWLLGRIKELYVGADGVCRVVDITTSKGIIRRAATKVCVLPTGDSS